MQSWNDIVDSTRLHQPYTNTAPRCPSLPGSALLAPVLQEDLGWLGSGGVDLVTGLAIIGDGIAMSSCNYRWFGTEALASLLLWRLRCCQQV